MVLPFSRLNGPCMRQVHEASKRPAVGLLLAAALVWPSLAAQAQGICVVCEGPAATYRCQPSSGGTATGDARLNLLCITEIAKSGRHDTCGVRRQQATCEGPVRTVDVGLAPFVPPDREPAAEATAPAAGAPPKSGPPETVADLAKRTASSSQDQLQKATDAVGDAAKKTGGAVNSVAKKSWRCLSTLFKEC